MRTPKAFHISIALIVITCCRVDNGAHGADKFNNNTDGRAPQPEWLYGYGTHNGEHVFEGLQTRDGGFIAIGKTR